MNAEIILDGIKIRIRFKITGTLIYFNDFITQRNCSGWDICVDKDDLQRYPLICPTGILDPFSEAYLLMPKVSAFLLKYDRVLIHGAAFEFQGKSWLITAPSGTGKTTQLRHWQHLHGEEIEIINGDKAVLSCREDGRIWLCPSPWTGKEKDAGNASAELGGIIVLEQAAYNKIYRIPPRDSVLQIFQQFLNVGDDKEEIRRMGKIASRILEKIPIWKLENLGDEVSAELTFDALNKYLEAACYEKI